MEEVTKILYEKFFMRDLLARIIPGLLVVVALLKHKNAVAQITWMADQDIPNWLLGILIIGTSYFVGLSLQNLAEFLGAFSTYTSPRFFLFIHVKNLPWGWCKKAQIVGQHSAKRFAVIRTQADKLGSEVLTQRERFAYLRDGSCVFSMALSVVCLIEWLSVGFNIAVMIPVLTMIIVLFLSHLKYREKLALFEISVLRESGLMSEEEINKEEEEVRNAISK